MARSTSVPLLALLLGGLAQALLAQGSLTPPGSPAPTMRSLDQIYDAVTMPQTDAGRIAIRAADIPLNITESGSYYLAESVSFSGQESGISIFASDVTLDLNGFTLTGPGKNAVGGNAVTLVNGISGVRILNGTIRDWASGGIVWVSSEARFPVISDVRVEEIGGVGISAGFGATIEDSIVLGTNGDGISAGDGAIVRRCRVENSGDTNLRNSFLVGSRSVIEGCVAKNNAGRGFSANFDSRYTDCTALANGADGFFLDGIIGGVHYVRCSSKGNVGSGFVLSARGVLIESLAHGNQQHGIQVSGNSAVSQVRIANSVSTQNSLNGLMGSGPRGSVLASYFAENGQDGINVGLGWIVRENHSSNNGRGTGVTDGAGIRASGGSTIVGNHSDFNDVGLASGAATNYFGENLLRSNSTAKVLNGATEGTGDLANLTF